MTNSNSEKERQQVFVPIEDIELVHDEMIVPYLPGVICVEWLQLQVEPIDLAS